MPTRKSWTRQKKIACPSCGCQESTVVPKWIAQPQDGSAYRRVRECDRCHTTFTTQEILERTA